MWIKSKKIEIIFYDFDGVMTDNRVLINSAGVECVWVHRGDGLAVAEIAAHGVRQYILSSERDPVVQRRAEKLGIPAELGVRDKAEMVRTLAHYAGVPLGASCAFVGNDVNDLSAMRIVGLAICPSDADIRVVKVAQLVLSRPGGHGVIRELLDHCRFAEA